MRYFDKDRIAHMEKNPEELLYKVERKIVDKDRLVKDLEKKLEDADRASIKNPSMVVIRNNIQKELKKEQELLENLHKDKKHFESWIQEGTGWTEPPLEFVGDTKWSFWKPGGFMFRKTTKYPRRPSQSTLTDFGFVMTDEGKDAGFKGYTRSQKDNWKKPDDRADELENIRDLYKQEASFDNKPLTKDTQQEFEKLRSVIIDAEDKYATKYPSFDIEDGKRIGNADEELKQARESVKGFGADLGAIAGHANKYANIAVKENTETFTKNTVGMGERFGIEDDFMMGRDVLLKGNQQMTAQQLATLKLEQESQHLWHDISSHIKARNDAVFNFRATNLVGLMSMGGASLSDSLLDFAERKVETGLLHKEEQKIETDEEFSKTVLRNNAVLQALSVEMNTDEALDSQNRFRPLISQELKTKIEETERGRIIRARAPQRQISRSEQSLTQVSRLRVGEAPPVFREEPRPTEQRFRDPLEQYASLKTIPFTDTGLDELMTTMPPELQQKQEQDMEMSQLRLDLDFARPTQQEYDDYIRERYDTEFTRTRPPKIGRPDSPIRPFFLPAIPLSSNKITKKTPTPKTFQKQILNPIGELKIVDKEQIKAYQADRHKLHDMAFNTGKKGLNLI